jgi:predicted O-linked N-acetylglucosamine transferase (SPINDLY family)
LSSTLPPSTIAEALQAGIAHHQAGQLAAAEQVYRQVLDVEPANPEALHLMGVIASQMGQPQVAVDLIGRAVGIEPDNAVFCNNLANALKECGRPVEAEPHYRRAIALKPDYADAHANLGILMQSLHRPSDAETCYRNALALRPVYPSIMNNLGSVLFDLGRLEDAESAYRTALAQQPAYAEAAVNLGQALRSLGRLGEAEQAMRRAVELRPNLAAAHNGLANVVRNLGKLEEAEASYRTALALDPDDAETHSNLVFLLNYLPAQTPQQIFAEHRRFAQRFATDTGAQQHPNKPQPMRRLRVGYVSADLRDHAVAFFIEPVLARHDRNEFEIYCYYNHARKDEITDRLRPLADHWRDVAGLKDDAFTALVRDDAIDILVDLSGHTGHNRLLAFNRRPAPVQVSWLGYLNTTGLDAMDYRITDAYASPRGPIDGFHTEKLVRVPGTQWCYRPPSDSPQVAPPPSVATGNVTFAVFANPAKISDPSIRLWARLLGVVPGARLIVAGATMRVVPQEFAERFIALGVPRERLTILGARPFLEYMKLHRDVDIILDTHPYSGGTTTCHALWMGVPVVTLTGETATSRGGASLLHAAGLEELITNSADEYVDVAATLARDPRRLARMRAGMRRRLAASPLMDEAGFTRNLEKAYRSMWRNWCQAQARQARLFS